MPLYEYQCEKCGESFETMQKFSDEPLATHEKCGGLVHRVISAPALQFKGSGWYINDYAKSGKPDANGASAKAESKESKPASSDSAAPSTSETKPASPPASSEKK
jgi:putative FmdB family regulatory protein